MYTHPYARAAVAVLEDSQLQVITKGGPYEVSVLQYDSSSKKSRSILLSFTIQAVTDENATWALQITYDGSKVRASMVHRSSAVLQGRREFRRHEYVAPNWPIDLATSGQDVPAHLPAEQAIESIKTFVSGAAFAFHVSAFNAP